LLNAGVCARSTVDTALEIYHSSSPEQRTRDCHEAGSIILSHVNDGGFWLIKRVSQSGCASNVRKLDGMRNTSFNRRSRACDGALLPQNVLTL